MENKEWLTDKKIQTLTAELLTDAYCNNIEKRLKFLYDIYFEVNGKYMFEQMLQTLVSYQKYIDKVIRRYTNENIFPDINDPKYREFEEKWLRDSLKKKKPVNPLDELPEKTDEEIETLRKEKIIEKFLLVGQFVSGVKGKISWYDIEEIKQKLILYIENLVDKKLTVYNLNNSEEATNKSTKKNIKVKKSNFLEFLNIDESFIEKLVNYLKVNYENNKPLEYAFMIEAMDGLNLLKKPLLKNRSELHRALESFFGEAVGSRANLSNKMNSFNNPSEPDKEKLEITTKRFKAFLKSL